MRLEGLVAFVSDSVKRSTAKATVAAMSSSSSVLNIMCDAVVQLGERLMLATSSSKLDVLLLRLPKGDTEPFMSLLDVTYHGRWRTCHLIGIVEESGSSQLEIPRLPTTNELQASKIRGGRGASLFPVADVLSIVVPAMTAVMPAALAVLTTVTSCPQVSSETRRAQTLQWVCGKGVGIKMCR